MKLTLLSPERRLVEGVVVEDLTLKGSEGEIQLLSGHAPMVSALDVGEFSFRADGGKLVAGVLAGGFFELKDELVTVMAEHVELRGEIDVAGAKQAQKEAEDALKESNLEEHQFKLYQLKLERALIRQQAAAKDH